MISVKSKMWEGGGGGGGGGGMQMSHKNDVAVWQPKGAEQGQSRKA